MIPSGRHFKDKGVFTRAGHPAGAFEVETTAAALDTARFIIAKGLVFKQDDSIGSGPSPSWRIHTLNEGARTALPVYRLEPLAAQA